MMYLGSLFHRVHALAAWSHIVEEYDGDGMVWWRTAVYTVVDSKQKESDRFGQRSTSSSSGLLSKVPQPLHSATFWAIKIENNLGSMGTIVYSNLTYLCHQEETLSLGLDLRSLVTAAVGSSHISSDRPP